MLTWRCAAILGLVIFALRGIVVVLVREIQLSGADRVQIDRGSIWKVFEGGVYRL